MQPSLKLLECITASWKAQALHAAAALGIADLLAQGPKTSAELAVACGAHAPSLYRLLQALTTLDICTEGPEGAFELTATGALLRSDAPDSLRAWTLWWGEYLWPVWGNLLYSVRTGASARKLLTGDSGFGHLERDATAAAIFNQGLVELTRLAAESVIRHYDFSVFHRIVDVGGGYGELLLAILKTNPGVSGTLFDLPHAVPGVQMRIAQAGLGERCAVLVGDFFELVPDGADAYVLKSVIHDWDDADSLRILANCRRALGGSGRLLLVEQILPDRLSQDARDQALMRSDLTMLVAHAARERTEAEYRRLLEGAGLRVTRVVATDSTFSVIEAVAA